MVCFIIGLLLEVEEELARWIAIICQCASYYVSQLPCFCAFQIKNIRSPFLGEAAGGNREKHTKGFSIRLDISVSVLDIIGICFGPC